MKINPTSLDSGTHLFSYQIVVELNHERLKALKAGHHAHLVLVHFLQRETMEFRIANCFEKFAKKLDPILLDVTLTNQDIYLNESSEIPIEDLLLLLKVRFQRLLKVSALVKPTFSSGKLIINQRYQPRKLKKHCDIITVDEMMLIRSQTDPFSLKAIGKPKTIRHFTFKSQQRYPLNLLD